MYRFIATSLLLSCLLLLTGCGNIPSQGLEAPIETEYPMPTATLQPKEIHMLVTPSPTPMSTPAPTPLSDVSDWNYVDGVLTIETQEQMDRWAELNDPYDDFEVVAFYNTFHTLMVETGVERIPYGSFLGCESLQTVYLNEGLSEIAADAFWHCERLSEINIPGSVTEIGGAAFCRCNLTSIQLPFRLETIGCELFSGCKSLRELTIPAEVETIYEYAFSGAGFERITFEGTVNEIVAFYLHESMPLKELVFLEGPPLYYGVGREDSTYLGMTFVAVEKLPTVYYLKENRDLWAPNGETDWNGCPLVEIRSIDDLPPLEDISEG